MTRYARLLTVTVGHDFFAPDRAPLKVVPMLPKTLLAADFLARVEDGQTEIICPDAPELDPGPITIAFDIVADDAQALLATPPLQALSGPLKPDAGETLVLDLAEDTETSTGRAASGTLMRFEIVLDPFATATTRLALSVPAVATVWSYHILGGDPDTDLAIRDPAGALAFEAVASPEMLADRAIRSFQADAPLPLRRRPSQRFELVHEGPFGPKVLVAPLPAAAAGLSATDGPARGHSPSHTVLKSDIFVTL